MLGIWCNGFQAHRYLRRYPTHGHSPNVDNNTTAATRAGACSCHPRCRCSPRASLFTTSTLSPRRGSVVALLLPDDCFETLKANGQIATQYVDATGCFSKHGLSLTLIPTSSLIEGITAPRAGRAWQDGHKAPAWPLQEHPRAHVGASVPAFGLRAAPIARCARRLQRFHRYPFRVDAGFARSAVLVDGFGQAGGASWLGSATRAYTDFPAKSER